MHFWDQAPKRTAHDKTDDYCPECKPVFKARLPVSKDIEVATPSFKLGQQAKADSLLSRILRRSAADQEANEAKAQEKREAREKKAAEKAQRETERQERKRQRKREEDELASALHSYDPVLYEAFPFLDEAAFYVLMGPCNPLHDDDDYEAWHRAEEMKRERHAEEAKPAEGSSRSDLQEPFPDGKTYTHLL
jgi:hypothetical protein